MDSSSTSLSPHELRGDEDDDEASDPGNHTTPSSSSNLQNLPRSIFEEESEGDVISPNLFTSTIQSMLGKIELKGGINIDGETLKILLFADDIILIAKTPQGLEDMLKQISGASNKIGLEVHPHKTQWMKNKYCRTEYTIHLNNTVIEKVKSYKYLGQTITMNNDLPTEIRNRKRAAWIGFNKIKDVLTDSKIDMPKRADLFNTYILPAMTYGGETWNTT
ncbi:hypothetical protein M8J77_021140 [Diaphorina citri]|nr:hypothetical protein M8J77_021140 [Diaphorina citri]